MHHYIYTIFSILAHSIEDQDDAMLTTMDSRPEFQTFLELFLVMLFEIGRAPNVEERLTITCLMFLRHHFAQL